MIRQVLLTLAVALPVYVGSRFVERRVFPEHEIVAVDLQRILNHELQRTSTQIATPEARNQRAREFAAALDKALAATGDNGRRIVLVAPAVVSGVVDETDQVEASLLAAIKGGGK